MKYALLYGALRSTSSDKDYGVQGNVLELRKGGIQNNIMSSASQGI